MYYGKLFAVTLFFIIFSVKAQQIDLLPQMPSIEIGPIISLLPTVPSTPSASIQTDNSILVRWSDVSADYYQLSANVNGIWSASFFSGSYTYNYHASPGSVYFFKVRACKAQDSITLPPKPPMLAFRTKAITTTGDFCSSWSSNSSSVSFLPVPKTPPAPSVSAVGLQIVLTWAAVVGANSYRLQEYNGSGWQPESDMGMLLEKAYTGAIGQYYQYRVRACNSSGCSSYSEASQPIQVTNRVITYLHTDVLGSVIAESNEAGQLKKTIDYRPFGESKDN